MKHQNPDCTYVEIGEWNCPKCFNFAKTSDEVWEEAVKDNREGCRNDPHGFHSFRDGTDFRTHCRLCGEPR